MTRVHVTTRRKKTHSSLAPSTGIGKAIAVRFAQEGANVAIKIRSGPDEPEATKVLVHEACLVTRIHGCRDLIVQADISKEDQIREMFQKVVGE